MVRAGAEPTAVGEKGQQCWVKELQQPPVLAGRGSAAWPIGLPCYSVLCGVVQLQAAGAALKISAKGVYSTAGSSRGTRYSIAQAMIKATEVLHLVQRTVTCLLGRRKQNFLAVFCFALPILSEELFCSLFTRNIMRNTDPVICLIVYIHFTARMV